MGLSKKVFDACANESTSKRMQCKPDDAHGRDLSAAQAGAWYGGHDSEAGGLRLRLAWELLGRRGHRATACESADSSAGEEGGNPGRRLAVPSIEA